MGTAIIILFVVIAIIILLSIGWLVGIFNRLVRLRRKEHRRRKK